MVVFAELQVYRVPLNLCVVLLLLGDLEFLGFGHIIFGLVSMLRLVSSFSL